MEIEKVNLQSKLNTFNEHWSPKIIGELNAGEFVIIPKGIDHKPYAPEEVNVLLFEPSSTLNTGNTENDLTVSDLDRI